MIRDTRSGGEMIRISQNRVNLEKWDLSRVKVKEEGFFKITVIG